MPALQPEGSLPAGYTETHAVVRSESHTVTVDQSGSGSSGTFTIDVVGSASASDLAGGWGEGTYMEGEPLGTEYTETVETSGGGSNSLSYHLVVSGTYANGTFTITSKTYTETSSYSRWQEVTRTQTVPSGAWYRESWDTEQSGSHTITWAAALDPQGVQVYTSYTQESEDTAHWHTRRDNSYGGYHDTAYDTSSSGMIVLSGGAGARTGAKSWSSLTAWWYPGTPGDEGSESAGESEPVSDTVDLPSLEEAMDGWEWWAGDTDVTGYSFHGVTEESAELIMTARHSTLDGYNWVYEVLDFDVTAHSSDSAHTIYDDPGMDPLGGGTTNFHRDELFTWANDVTGSGSYLDGATDATYQAVQTAGFAVDNEYVVTGSHTSGTNEEGEPYDLLFNFSRDTVGAGTYTTTYDYHDTGDGVELTNSTYTHDATSTATGRSWGNNMGVAFDTTSVTTDPTAGSISFAGSPGPVAEADGLVGAVPFRHLIVPNDLFYVQTAMPAPLPTTPVRGRPGLIQDWYNRKVQEIGGAAARLVTNQVVLRMVMNEINDTPQRPDAAGERHVHPPERADVRHRARSGRTARSGRPPRAGGL